jgi:hypothetical protein
VHKGIITAVKKVEFVSDRMSFTILRGHINILSVYGPTGDTIDDVKEINKGCRNFVWRSSISSS